jgi:hypothetical protein
MRRATICALTLAAAALTCQLVWADDPTAVNLKPSPPGNGVWSWVPWGKSTSKAKDGHDITIPETKPALDLNKGPTPRALAEANYMRRFDMCLKLEEIAQSTNDDVLRRKVEVLRQKISDVYARRTEYLPMSRTIADTGPTASSPVGISQSGATAKER